MSFSVFVASQMLPLPTVGVADTAGFATNANGYARAALFAARPIHDAVYSAPHVWDVIASSPMSNRAHISAMPDAHLRHVHLPVVPWSMMVSALELPPDDVLVDRMPLEETLPVRDFLPQPIVMLDLLPTRLVSSLDTCMMVSMPCGGDTTRTLSPIAKDSIMMSCADRSAAVTWMPRDRASVTPAS